MKIKVDRINKKEESLVFTITVTEPNHACFGNIEKQIMIFLDICKNEVDRVSSKENKIQEDVSELIQLIKERAFLRVLQNLKFSIQNDFQPRFNSICQEIYNWIKENQTDVLKTWMQEFDPQRTAYYFDNDCVAAKSIGEQESEHNEFDIDDETDNEI